MHRRGPEHLRLVNDSVMRQGKADYTPWPKPDRQLFIQPSAPESIAREEEKTMSRLPVIQTEAADRRGRELLEAVQAKLKITPNMTRVMANSPAVLEGYLGLSGALAAGSLPPQLRERIALAVGEQNGCQYCVSAHTAIGKLTGLADKEIEEAREARSQSAKDQMALEFTRILVAKHGRMTDADFERLQKAGFSAGEIAEIIAHTALNIFTNYFNTAADVDVDFPKVALRRVA
jgi:uncharacterized peroxidase-related enzyme